MPIGGRLLNSSRYYECGDVDSLIDERIYSKSDGALKLSDSEFESGIAIGSDWFKFQVKRNTRG